MGDGPAPDLPETVVDLSGRTMLPGLIDAHVHLALDGSPDPMNNLAKSSVPVVTLQTARHARQTLEAGVTTVRDLGCREFIDVAFRDAVKAGLVMGPDMLCAGQMICITGGHGWQVGYEADGPEEVRKGVRFQIKSGVDVVKFMATGGVLTRGGRPGMPQLTALEMAAGIEEAHRVGLKTAAHSQGPEGAKNAVAAGIDSLEHGVDLDQEVIDQMAERGVFVVPTLSAPFNILEAGRDSGIPQEFIDKTERMAEIHLDGLSRAKKAGVKIAMGTDAGTPFNQHGQNAAELVHLGKIGFTPMEAITCATSSAAELLGIEETAGSIAPGKRADLLIVEGNPLQDLALLTDPGRIVSVYKAGRRVGA
jgi:imidazolonepropionase-like amidohydrolase